MAASRKRDAHEKITLGGLIIKAGLREEDKAFILGVLLTASEQRDDSALREAMIAKGKEAFRT